MSDFSQITALILAGGLGTRLQKVVSDRSKVMAEINGKSFLCYLLDQLAEADIERAVVSTGYMAEQIEERIGGKYKDVEIVYSKEENPLGTGGALKLAVRVIGTKYCLVMNGDSYTEFDPASLLMNHKKSDSSITIVVKEVKDSSRYGTIQMDEQNKIVEFTEKGRTAARGLINAGVYIIENLALQEIPGKIPCSLEHDFFPFMIERGINGYKTGGRFIDIGTPKSYAKAEKFFEDLPVPK